MKRPITMMLLTIEIDDDVARAAGVPPDAQEISFTRARVLLEAQWLKHQNSPPPPPSPDPS